MNRCVGRAVIYLLLGSVSVVSVIDEFGLGQVSRLDKKWTCHKSW